MVIADSSVASRYLALMGELGVGIGLHKSLIARDRVVLEFAKKYFVDGKNCSMLPLKEVIATRTIPALGGELMQKYSVSFPGLINLLGYGYRVLGGLNRPIGK